MKTLALVTLLLLVAGCGRDPSPSGPPLVVASIHPLAMICQELVGESVEVVCMLPPGMSPHASPDTADTMKSVADARLIVVNGGGLDTWANSAAKAAGRDAAAVWAVADALDIEPADGRMDHAQHDHGPAHVHGPHCSVGVDPHFWLDPGLAMRFIPAIADRLGERMPDDAAAIQSRAEALVASLRELDERARAKFEPYAGGAIVTFHDAFGRLAERYGLEVAATLTPMNSPGDVTPDAITRVLAVIKQYQLKAIYCEPQFSPDAAKLIRQEAGVSVLTLDPIGDPMDRQRSTYVGLLRYNIDKLAEGLAAE